ncbi:putative phage abortive infection protein [Chryseobacterium sp. G0201]|uniref:putative phage abortive infection protein n=1 Tax=Chryseobacterium sp. G0201 TaxID=2487065 RepID=UPI000F4E5D98|nr:putative phage abortive infection protein [Chryseobacterium sp. G0201]AZA54056.1 hypothetical protein EG348_14135 [Chryseobacterium sp. G0201]
MKDKNDGNILFYVALAILVIFGVLGSTYMIQSSEADRGTFGDMFGFANALFTGLSVIGLIATILLQRKDLNHQRDELHRQNIANFRQNFENTFFNMINVHHQIVNAMTLTYSETNRHSITVPVVVNARGVFRYLFGIIYKSLNTVGDNFHKIYKEQYLHYNYHLDHYYNNFYEVIKFIDESDLIDNKLKNRYSEILSSQLSEHEKLMIFYHIIYYPSRGLKNLVEKYDLIKNFNYDNTVSDFLLSKYSPKLD